MSVWPVVSLGEIFDIARGGSPRPIQDFTTDDPDGVNWIMIGDAQEGTKYITSTKKRIKQSGVSRSRMVHPGDFLLTNSMSFGRPYIMKTSGCIHDGWLVLSRKNNDVHPDYFYHLLGSDQLYAEFARQAAGATVKNLNIDLVKAVKVRLPPLDKQRRIAAILDKADAIRRKRQQALALADDFLRSAFLEMFGAPRRNPYGFPTEPLECVAQIQRGRFSPRPRNDPAYYGGNLPFIQTGDIAKADGYLTRWTQTLNEKGAKVSKSFPKGIVVIAIVGATIGETAILGQETYFPDSVIGISPQPDRLTPEYVEYALRFWKQAFRDLAPETARANINIETLRPIPFVIPPLETQERFSCIYNRIHADVRQKLSSPDDLFASLSQRAFRGEL